MTEPQRPTSNRANWSLSPAPAPFEDEARSSWLARAAHRHHLATFEMAAIYGIDMAAADLGSHETQLAEIARRSRLGDWPAVHPVVDGLALIGRLERRVRCRVEDWWAYCPHCLEADLSGNGFYVRQQWCEPFSVICAHHKVWLRPWPSSAETRTIDGQPSFVFTEGDFAFREAEPAVIQTATLLRQPAIAGWDRWAMLVLDLGDALLCRCGPQGQEPAALFEFTDFGPWSGIGARRPGRNELLSCDVALRLTMMRAIISLVSFDPATATSSPNWLRELVRANSRAGVRRELLPGCGDPLFRLFARMNDDAANALSRRVEEWPAEVRVRAHAALLVGALANHA